MGIRITEEEAKKRAKVLWEIYKENTEISKTAACAIATGIKGTAPSVYLSAITRYGIVLPPFKPQTNSVLPEKELTLEEAQELAIHYKYEYEQMKVAYEILISALSEAIDLKLLREEE